MLSNVGSHQRNGSATAFLDLLPTLRLCLGSGGVPLTVDLYTSGARGKHPRPWDAHSLASVWSILDSCIFCAIFGQEISAKFSSFLERFTIISSFDVSCIFQIVPELHFSTPKIYFLFFSKQSASQKYPCYR